MSVDITRREVLAGAGTAVAMGIISKLFDGEALASGTSDGKPSFIHKPPPLPYPDDALEPVIDSQTIKIHHGKHFAAYVDGLNSTLEKLDKARKDGAFDNIKALSRDLAFNGSGVVLHWIYFNCIGPKAGGEPTGVVADLIKRDFGSYESFWKQFSAASKSVEASGWGILAWEPFSKRLVIMQAEKHQNLASWGAVPIMVCDVWEHAYYLKYQNRRAEYVDNFAKIIDWNKVETQFHKFCSSK
jgi:superoxide dismutase, Fe-Mn family